VWRRGVLMDFVGEERLVCLFLFPFSSLLISYPIQSFMMRKAIGRAVGFSLGIVLKLMDIP